MHQGCESIRYRGNYSGKRGGSLLALDSTRLIADPCRSTIDYPMSIGRALGLGRRTFLSTLHSKQYSMKFMLRLRIVLRVSILIAWPVSVKLSFWTFS